MNKCVQWKVREIGKRRQIQRTTNTNQKCTKCAHERTHARTSKWHIKKCYLSHFTIAANTNTYTHKWTNKHSAHHELVDFGPRITFQNAYHFFWEMLCCLRLMSQSHNQSFNNIVSISFDTVFFSSKSMRLAKMQWQQKENENFSN